MTRYTLSNKSVLAAIAASFLGLAALPASADSHSFEEQRRISDSNDHSAPSIAARNTSSGYVGASTIEFGHNANSDWLSRQVQLTCGYQVK